MFTGSFKERGARNALLALSEEKKAKGVVAASAGNHALALSWHGLWRRGFFSALCSAGVGEGNS